MKKETAQKTVIRESTLNPTVSTVTVTEKQVPFSEEELVKAILLKTASSPLLLAGIVQERGKKEGKNDRGEWRMIRVIVRGCEGRTKEIFYWEMDKVPKVGDFVIIPCYIRKDGTLCEARDLFESF